MSASPAAYMDTARQASTRRRALLQITTRAMLDQVAQLAAAGIDPDAIPWHLQEARRLLRILHARLDDEAEDHARALRRLARPAP
jgi:hypothetical protein